MVKLPDIVRGDTLPALTFDCVFVDEDGNTLPPPDLFGSAVLQFRDKEGQLLASLSTTGNTLTFTLDGTTWRLVSTPIIISTKYVGLVRWDIETVSQPGVVRTFFPESTINLIRDYSRAV